MKQYKVAMPVWVEYLVEADDDQAAELKAEDIFLGELGTMNTLYSRFIQASAIITDAEPIVTEIR